MDGQLKLMGFGHAMLSMTFRIGEPRKLKLFDVLYVQKLSYNVFSVGAAKKGNIVQFGESCCWIRDKHEKLHGVSKRRNDGLYQFCCSSFDKVRASVAVQCDADLWHQRLGHLAKQRLEQAVKGKMVH